MSIGTFRAAGLGGYGWSSRATGYNSSTAAFAYELGFTATSTTPSNGPYDRWGAFPLRCLSTVLDM